MTAYLVNTNALHSKKKGVYGDDDHGYRDHHYRGLNPVVVTQSCISMTLHSQFSYILISCIHFGY